MGLRLAVDDFGTGYSSFSYLRKLPVHEIKIDKSFIDDMVEDGDEVIVQSTIELAHNLGLTCVAEGVQDEATLERLAKLGCDTAQGDFISPPLDGPGVAEWLRQRGPAAEVTVRASPDPRACFPAFFSPSAFRATAIRFSRGSRWRRSSSRCSSVHRSWPAFRARRAPSCSASSPALGYFGGTVYWTGTVVTQFGGLSCACRRRRGRAPRRVPLAVSRAVHAVPRMARREVRPPRDPARAGGLGDDRARRARISGAAFRGCCSGTARRPCCRSRSSRASSACSACPRWSRSSARRSRTSSSRARAARSSPLASTAAVLVGVTIWGNRRLENDELVEQGRPVRVALIQGNIPQDQKWDDAQAGQHPEHLSDDDARGRRARARSSSSGPSRPRRFRSWTTRSAARGFARSCARRVSSCCSAAIRWITQTKSYYNAAFLVRKDGTVAGVYQKMHLVPFGEFVPLQQLLFFVGPLVEQAGGIHAGPRHGDAADEPRADQHGHLLRDRVSAAGAASRCCEAASC